MLKDRQKNSVRIVERFLICCGLFALPLPAICNEVIDLRRPVSESIPSINGIYWSFDQMTEGGESVRDGSPNQFNGLLYPGNGEMPKRVPGVDAETTQAFGSALRLETAAEEPGDLGNPRIGANLPVENPLGMSGVSFTGGIWIRLDSTKEAGTQRIVLFDRGCLNLRLGEDNAGHYGLVLDRDATGNWQIGFGTGDGLTVSRAASETLDISALDDGKWHHIGFNYHSGGNGKNSVTFWFDGQDLGEMPIGGEITSGNTDSAVRRFYVGDCTTPSYMSNFNGAVDDAFVTEGIYDFSYPGPGDGQ